ncbi:uncharacterized protein LOC130629968 [Hydractinia symbiolongicarpus]|uniref:uncharacterized protein LOC130629968 n=1 Tax=Hydractinia symbiolongicarpus TaxID=13093 RepID=UPI00254D8341|nr:uncharacterized protein LOC130629968 [Hydractinia symbiolongicarpus]
MFFFATWTLKKKAAAVVVYILSKKRAKLDIEKKTTHLRDPIPAKVKVAATLKFLSCGINYVELQYLFRVHKSNLSQFIPEVCEAIYMQLKEKYLKTPCTEEEWRKIALQYEELWTFPNCIGSMNGKHIVIKQPKNSGSFYFKYKGTFSIVLLALVDANYKFIYVDVGCNGRISVGAVYQNSTLSKAIHDNVVNIPPQRLVGNGEYLLPHFIVADDAFPLKKYIMKPYAFRGLSREKRIFNYRLSRARRIVENAFGILANRFRVVLSPMLLPPENVKKVTLACCALHNFLRKKKPSEYSPPGSFDVKNLKNGSVHSCEWRSQTQRGMESINFAGSNNYKNDARIIRDKFCAYFNSTGAVPWQETFV